MVDPRIVTITQYQRQAARARQQLLGLARRMWGAQASYRGGDVEEFLALLMPQLIAGRIAVAQVTDLYLAAMTQTTPLGVDPALADTLRRGVTDHDVYTRPFRQVWINLAKGRDLNTAVDAGMVRLVSLIETDLQLAKQAQEQTTLTAAGVKYYRRTLTGGENCALCVIASTQRYTVGTLSPIHPGCDCDTAPILGTTDPGRVLNAQLLEQMHYQVEERAGTSERTGRQILTPDGEIVEYRDLLIVDHPEFGPTLDWRPDKRSKAQRAPSPDAEPDYDTPFGRSYWERRRDALGLDFGNDADQIRPPEIRTVERLLGRGDVLTPIPRDPSPLFKKATSDYDWRRHETPTDVIRIEIKSLEPSTHLHKATFPMRIKKSVGRSSVTPETRKRGFLVDAGDRDLEPDVLRALEHYNLDNPAHAVERLF